MFTAAGRANPLHFLVLTCPSTFVLPRLCFGACLFEAILSVGLLMLESEHCFQTRE
jgi:hypothetical protein